MVAVLEDDCLSGLRRRWIQQAAERQAAAHVHATASTSETIFRGVAIMGAPLPSIEIRNGVCTRCGETKPPHYVPATTGKPLCFRCEIARMDRAIAWQATMIALCGTVAIIGFILIVARALGRI